MGAYDAWVREQEAAYLYRILATAEAAAQHRALFAKLADEAMTQAAVWARQSAALGRAVPTYTPTTRVRVVASLLRWLPPRRLRMVLAAMKVRGMSVYDAPPMGHPVPTSVDEIGRRHHSSAAGGNLRAAIFGVNDGLISNASLILGVAGAASEDGAVVLAGVAGLLAGAFSMAAGEYVSVRSQREMLEHQIAAEREELLNYPEEEAAELALIYHARGVPKADAEAMAQRIIADPEHALDALAREELGLDPHALGSPWGAAGFSFLSFSLGALVPIAPYMFATGAQALRAAVGLTAAALYTVGALLSLFTGRGAWRGGLRVLCIGAAAGALTFAVGRLLGVTLR